MRFRYYVTSVCERQGGRRSGFPPLRSECGGSSCPCAGRRLDAFIAVIAREARRETSFAQKMLTRRPRRSSYSLLGVPPGRRRFSESEDCFSRPQQTPFMQACTRPVGFATEPPSHSSAANLLHASEIAVPRRDGGHRFPGIGTGLASPYGCKLWKGQWVRSVFLAVAHLTPPGAGEREPCVAPVVVRTPRER